MEMARIRPTKNGDFTWFSPVPLAYYVCVEWCPTHRIVGRIAQGDGCKALHTHRSKHSWTSVVWTIWPKQCDQPALISSSSSRDGCGFRGRLLESWGQNAFFYKEPHSKCFRLCGPEGLYGNDSALLLQWENSHRSYVRRWVWLCSNKTLFKKIRRWSVFGPRSIVFWPSL